MTTQHTHEISVYSHGRVFVLPRTPSTPATLEAGWLAALMNDTSRCVCATAVFNILARERVPQLVRITDSPTLFERACRLHRACRLGDAPAHRVTCTKNAACFVYGQLQARVAKLTPPSKNAASIDPSVTASQSWDLGRMISVYNAHERVAAYEIDALLAEHTTRVAKLREQDDAVREILRRGHASLSLALCTGWILDAQMPLALTWEPTPKSF